MKAAIYARKSLDTQKGESIENQIDRCKAWCDMKGIAYDIYSDLNFSGKNLERPEFQKMFSQIKKYDFLVCYRLDRVSRNVGDFYNLFIDLQKNGCDFFSLNENFDTSTPLGRAMLTIASVFAQLERETIAERVRDNMLDRAKKGRFNGGRPPLGYTIVRKGKNSMLVEDERADDIRTIFEVYINEKTLRSTAFKLNDMNIRTINNTTWTATKVRRILSNPVYCTNSPEAYEFFQEMDISHLSLSDFDGQNGMIAYNKREAGVNLNPVDEWIIGIGEHIGIVSGETFVVANRLLKHNKLNRTRTHAKSSPLVGMVRCGKCGRKMSITWSFRANRYLYYFSCTRNRDEKCSPLIRADRLEEAVIGKIESMYSPEFINELKDYGKNYRTHQEKGIAEEKKKLQAKHDEIGKWQANLISKAGKGIVPDAELKKQYDLWREEREEILKKIKALQVSEEESIEVESFIERFLLVKELYPKMEIDERMAMLRSIINEVVVHENRVEVLLNFQPSQPFAHEFASVNLMTLTCKRP